MSLKVKEKGPIKRAGVFLGQADSDSESAQTEVESGAPAADSLESAGEQPRQAKTPAGAGADTRPDAVEAEVAAAEEGLADGAIWREGEKPAKKKIQAKGFGVRLPGLEEDFAELQAAALTRMAVASARLVLVGAVSGLIELGKRDIAQAEALVRAEVVRRVRRKRGRLPGDQADYLSQLHSVRLGSAEQDFAQLKRDLIEFSEDLDTSNQVMIAAAVSAYLPVTDERVTDLLGQIRDVVVREQLERNRRKQEVAAQAAAAG